MENLVGKWGGTNLYSTLQGGHLELIHPDDWEKLKNYSYIRSLHQCTAVNGDFITISFGDDFHFRVKRSLFTPVDPVPQFKPFEIVKFMNSKGVLEFGEIRDVSWHNNDRKYYYGVMVNDKMKGRRYFEDDLDTARINSGRLK